ncbi:LysM peptidoglycan-binding domain-containing protein [Aestuariibius sp. HNIBRBA575]|uniref:LysM peptidoglycan-binding domain-containing protein n=1 Tax=Aestuariibius sp. HNIBRBA575 TaxID=3233343 RepID=UPI0034A587DF
MIRSVIAIFSFAVVLCLFIIFRSTGERQPQVADIPPAPVIPQEVVEVTRAPAEPMIIPAERRPAMPVDAMVQPQSERTGIMTDSTSMQDMTINVLADLGLATNEPPVPLVDENLQNTASILAGIQAVTGRDADIAPRESLQNLVVTALQAGESDAYIDALINEAAKQGEITVPEVLVTSDGRVDTATLLSNIVTQAQIAATGVAPEVPVLDPTQSEGVEVRVVQRATETVQNKFYTVQRGDSLGGIAIKFYGNAAEYRKIFDANRQLLSSPDTIRAGQRLFIPT